MSYNDEICGSCNWMKNEVCANRNSEFFRDIVTEDEEACMTWDPVSEDKEKIETAAILEYTMSISNRKDGKANEMLQTVKNLENVWSVGKMNRWIGYAQCLLVAEGATTIDKLREDIRELV